MKLKTNQGVAGLTVLLSLVVFLFMMGLLIMIFSLMSGGLRDATYTATTASVNNETITTLNNTVGDLLSKSTLNDVVCTVVRVQNVSSGAIVPASNYTMTNCLIKGNAGTYLNQNVNVTYSYTYNADNTATNVMNDTSDAIGSVTDWFDLFLVIGAMVVLIMLVVIIVTTIRSSGLIEGSSGASKVGTA